MIHYIRLNSIFTRYHCMYIYKCSMFTSHQLLFAFLPQSAHSVFLFFCVCCIYAKIKEIQKGKTKERMNFVCFFLFIKQQSILIYVQMKKVKSQALEWNLNECTLSTSLKVLFSFIFFYVLLIRAIWRWYWMVIFFICKDFFLSEEGNEANVWISD